MITELNPCPFCKPELSITKYGYTGMTERFPHWVRCMTCGLEMRSETEMGVIQDWNTRPLEDALQSRITELEKLVKDWQEIAQYAGRIIEQGS